MARDKVYTIDLTQDELEIISTALKVTEDFWWKDRREKADELRNKITDIIQFINTH